MIHQVVLVRLRPEATDEQRHAIADGLAALQQRISGIRAMRMGFDLRFRPENFDFGVAVDFETVADYLAYRDHEAHQQVVEKIIRPILLERRRCRLRVARARRAAGTQRSCMSTTTRSPTHHGPRTSTHGGDGMTQSFTDVSANAVPDAERRDELGRLHERLEELSRLGLLGRGSRRRAPGDDKLQADRSPAGPPHWRYKDIHPMLLEGG